MKREVAGFCLVLGSKPNVSDRTCAPVVIFKRDDLGMWVLGEPFSDEPLEGSRGQCLPGHRKVANFKRPDLRVISKLARLLSHGKCDECVRVLPNGET